MLRFAADENFDGRIVRGVFYPISTWFGHSPSVPTTMCWRGPWRQGASC